MKNISLIFVFVSFGILVSPMSNAYEASMVSEKGLEDYAKRYLEKYYNLFEAYKGSLGDLEEFMFYSSYPYHVRGILSEMHGAAIFFYASTNQTIEIETISERIEFYLWPNMKEYSSDTFWEREYPEESGFTSYEFAASLQIGDGINSTYCYHGENTLAIFLDAGYPTYAREYRIRVMPLGRLRVDGVLVYENRMILKGTNDVKAWTTDVASLDATNEFLRLARKHVLDEAQFRDIACLSLLIAKAEQIGQHFLDGSYTNEDLRWKEEREFWDIVDSCGIEKELAQDILNEVIPKQEEPRPFDPSNPLWWIIVPPITIACSVIAALGVAYITGKWRPNLFKSKDHKSKKKKHKRKKRMKTGVD